jgi:hypothetical protein
MPVLVRVWVSRGAHPGGEATQGFGGPAFGMGEGVDGFAGHGVVAGWLGGDAAGGREGVQDAGALAVHELGAGEVDVVVSVACDPAGKLTSIIAGMAVGADSIADLDVLGAGRCRSRTPPGAGPGRSSTSGPRRTMLTWRSRS